MAGDDFSKNQRSQCVAKLEVIESVDLQGGTGGGKGSRCQAAIGVFPEKGEEKTGVGRVDRHGFPSIRAAHVLVEFLKFLFGHRNHCLVIATAERGAFAQVHRFLWRLLREFLALHHHVLALLHPFDDEVEPGPEILESGGFHRRSFTFLSDPVKT